MSGGGRRRQCQRAARTWRLGVLAALLAAASAPAVRAEAECGAPTRLRFELVRTIARNALGLTQGLEMHGSRLYESTGRIDGTSQVNVIDLSGQVTTLVELGTKVFGEGLTVLDGEVFQLTWQEHEVFVYDLAGRKTRTMHNPYFGWGLANDGHALVFTDGSEWLRFADPKTFAETRSLAIRVGARALRGVNELEFVDRKLYGNVFLTREIVRLDPQTGCVEAVADLSALWNAMDEAERQRIEGNPQYVLNGIAYDRERGLFYLTGKRWRYIFAGRFR
ncbi:MAG TPA: glutaminyl-peptide cyclotransferase [Xanthobacteraceae bacterium]|nr:glutaminyl-peptide cyclotransferase [Xanthobacteraceae bacterium]